MYQRDYADRPVRKNLAAVALVACIFGAVLSLVGFIALQAYGHSMSPRQLSTFAAQVRLGRKSPPFWTVAPIRVGEVLTALSLLLGLAAYKHPLARKSLMLNGLVLLFWALLILWMGGR
jgi:hypothetical protein